MTLTATFRLLHIFLVLDIGTRRILHWNVTEHPTAEWTAQQFRSFSKGDEPYRFVVHDRDALFSPGVDEVLRSMDLRVLKTPARVPQANALCERLIGTARRECLDHLIPLTERQLRKILAEWVSHDNHGRPHASLGPGFPSQRCGPCCDRPATSFRTDIAWLPNQFSLVSITRTALSASQHDFCGAQGSAAIWRTDWRRAPMSSKGIPDDSAAVIPRLFVPMSRRPSTSARTRSARWRSTGIRARTARRCMRS